MLPGPSRQTSLIAPPPLGGQVTGNQSSRRRSPVFDRCREGRRGAARAGDEKRILAEPARGETAPPPLPRIGWLAMNCAEVKQEHIARRQLVGADIIILPFKLEIGDGLEAAAIIVVIRFIGETAGIEKNFPSYLSRQQIPGRHPAAPDQGKARSSLSDGYRRSNRALPDTMVCAWRCPVP